LIAQRAFGELEAACAGRVVEKTEKVDMTRAADSTRVVASFRFTSASLSPGAAGDRQRGTDAEGFGAHHGDRVTAPAR
jgi:hypothetical protein